MKPRIDKPQKGNPYYINKKDGGLNPAKGNPARLNKDLTALPNCVAIYSWFNEIGGQGQVYLKKAYYPYAVIDVARREGLEITDYPTEGGIMVWKGGRTGEGHVEGCALVYSKDEILSVGSEYYGVDWRTYTRRRGTGDWRLGCNWMDSSYVFCGCIRNPFMVYEKPKGTKPIVIEQDGIKIECTGFNVDGHNYIALADLDKPLGYANVKWDANKRLPILTSKGR